MKDKEELGSGYIYKVDITGTFIALYLADILVKYR